MKLPPMRINLYPWSSPISIIVDVEDLLERKVSHSGTSNCYHYSKRRLAPFERLCTLLFNLRHR